MGKLYYTLTEATAHLGEDAVNLGERGLLPMAFRWPEANNTMKTGFAIEYMAPGYERVQFSYITPKEFCRVVNAARRDDKIIVRHTFVSLEDLARADEIIERRNKSASAALAESLFNHGVPRRNTYMGLDDLYVTAEAMAAFLDDICVTAATPGAKVEAVNPGDWAEHARTIADRIALERYSRGEREITARNICDEVQLELAKDVTTHGNRGERSAGNIRNEALRGWKFNPPTGTNGTSGTKK